MGHRFHLRMNGGDAVPCEVAEAEPPRLLTYTFNAAWTLRWELAPEGGGTRLRLRQSGFLADDPDHQAARERMGVGWRDVVLPQLASVAEEPVSAG